MPIPLDGLMGFIRTRPRRGGEKTAGAGAAPDLELWIDTAIPFVPGAAGVTVGKPADCAGVLYAAPGGKLEVRYPPE